MRSSLLLGLVALATFVAPASAQQAVRVTVENLQPTDGFYLTPVWVGFHNGGFDYFDSGALASAATEALAEGGVTEELEGEFAAFGSGQDGVLANADGFGGAPVLDPGEAASMLFNLDASERYLSFASMIIPSNDGFFGNDNGMGIEVLDSMGNFSFTGPIEFSLSDLYDAGTELNDGLGAPFSANGGTSTDESMDIALHGGLDNFDGTDTAAGTTINFANASSSPVLRLTVSAVPEPGCLAFVSLLGAVGLIRRNRRA